MRTILFALRRLWTRPGFSAVAIGTLALGIGANAAIFSLVRAVLLHPLPYPHPDALVRVVGYDHDDEAVGNLAPGDFQDFERETVRFARMGAHGFVGSVTIAGSTGDAERVGGVNVTEGFFPALGIQPALGRTFTRDDDRPDAPITVLISDGFWRRRFAADPHIVGSPITLNARPATVIGVLPATWRHIEINPDRSADVFWPYRFDPASPSRGGHFIRAVGRLADGARVEDARAELETIAARLEQAYPVSNHGQSVQLASLHEAMVGESRLSLALLSGAVGLVLLIACANVANLLLASGAARQREFAVRTAMGASRGRLMGQLLIEGSVLSGLGAAAGLVLAWWATRAIVTAAGTSLPRIADATVDGGVLAMTAGVTAITALAFGLVPALQISRQAVHDALKEGGRQASAAPRRRVRELFIAVQVALAVVLLVGAGLLARTLWRLQDVPAGFTTSQVMAMDVSLPVATYAEGDQISFYEQLQARVAAMPGVTGVGAVNILPLSANYDSRGIQIEDRPKPDGQGEAPQARSATPGYFQALGVPLVRGRLFDHRDLEGAPRVVIVSETMARRYWPGEDAVGKRITFNSGIPGEDQRVVGGPGSREVVGVVGDVRHLGMAEDDIPMFYTPHAQQPSYHTMTLVVRAAGALGGLPASVREALRAMDGGVPLFQVRSIDQVLSRAVSAPRVRAGLVGLFAVVACLLASIGVYGVVSFLVGQRSHEIGVRLSLGATSAHVVRLVLGEGLRPIVAGLVVGIAGAWVGASVIESLLFGVTSHDPATFVGAAILLLVTAVAAMLVPLRRALAVEAAQALRA